MGQSQNRSTNRIPSEKKHVTGPATKCRQLGQQGFSRLSSFGGWHLLCALVAGTFCAPPLHVRLRSERRRGPSHADIGGAVTRTLTFKADCYSAF